MMPPYHRLWLRGSNFFLKVSLVSKDSSMLDGLDNASIEMEEAKVSFPPYVNAFVSLAKFF